MDRKVVAPLTPMHYFSLGGVPFACGEQAPVNSLLHYAVMIAAIDSILARLEKEVAAYAVPVVDLIAVQTRDPYRILVAAMLSARTRDEVTARAAARLFKKAPDLHDLAGLSEKEIARLIHPVGFYRNKARFLASMPAVVERLNHGCIPDDIDTLLKLPGVGRKTANLVVSVAFAKPAICVDTHVHRIVNIWGYVSTKTPLETEMALRRKLPTQYWRSINRILVAFGQKTCTPLRPHCDVCVIEKECPKIGVVPRRLRGQGAENEGQVMEGGKMEKNGTKKLISWNVNGIRALEKKGLADIILELAPDIIGLQEIKAQPDQLPETLRNIPGYTAFWHPANRKGYAGVCTYSAMEPARVITGMGNEEHDREGRVLTLEFVDFYFVNVYFPNAQHGLVRLEYKLSFNRDFLDFVDRLARQKTVVVCGDFNVAHKEIDLKNPKENMNNAGFSAPERAWMDAFIKAGYIDTFRKFHHEPGNYTWWTYRFNARAKNIGWRIDYFFVDAKSESRVQSAAILKDIMGSDHCPVRLDFR